MEPETNYIKIRVTNVCIIAVYNIILLDGNIKSYYECIREAYS